MNSADITEDRWQEYMRDHDENWLAYDFRRQMYDAADVISREMWLTTGCLNKEELWVFYKAKRKGERYDH